MKINERTRKLLQESKLQSGLLRQQEEEMRQNKVELQAAQKDLFRRSSNLEKSI